MGMGGASEDFYNSKKTAKIVVKHTTEEKSH